VTFQTMDNEQNSRREVDERAEKTKSDSTFEPLYLKLDLELLPKDLSVSLTTDKTKLTKFNTTDIEDSFLSALSATDKAKLAISNLPNEDKERWRQYQIKLADASTSGEYKDYQKCLDKRNADFPEIALQLANAAEHINKGERTLAIYKTNQTIAAAERQTGSPHLPQIALFGRETSTATHRLESNQLLFKGSWQNGNTAFDLHESRAPLFGLRARNQPQEETYSSLFRGSAKAGLAAIDQPGHREIAKMRGEHIVEKLKSELSPLNSPEIREKAARSLTADVEAIMRNQRSSFASKDQFFKQVERILGEDTAPSFATRLDRRTVACQLLSHAANVTAIDQGNFKTCAISSIEKRLLERQPDLLSKMIADVAISGTTTSATGRTITLEKDWLACDNSEATQYPPRRWRALTRQSVFSSNSRQSKIPTAK
jgi:hypothetical protein